LAIDRFSGDGILIDASDFSTVSGCVIGSDSAGGTGRGNGADGIAIVASLGVHVDAVIQGFPEGNTIVGNGGNGESGDATRRSETTFSQADHNLAVVRVG
jgi:hypothetical protein